MKANLLTVLVLLGAAGHVSAVVAQSEGTFTATANMTTPRLWHTATLLADGRVLIAGGMNVEQSSSTYLFKALARAELYDPATGVFTPTGDMTTSRGRHTATLLPDGRVLIAGCGPLSPNGTWESLASAEIYDPQTGFFARTGGMTEAHLGHGAPLLRNGQVLLVGGRLQAAQLGLQTTELYDPVVGIFTAAGEMTSMVADTATLFSNGKVRATGDFQAEVYDPSTGAFAVAGHSAQVPTVT